MRVEQSKSNAVPNSETSGTKQTGRAAAPQSAKKTEKAEKTSSTDKSQGARAEISSRGKEFASARAAATGAPDVREDKIADIKKRIAEGNYKVNTDAVADRMIDDHLKMSGIS